MSRRYDLAIFSGTRRLVLPTNRATGVTCSTGPRGFQDFTAFIPMGDVQADQLTQTPLLRVQLSYGGVLWEGRVEDLALRNGGVEIGALGDARVLDDVLYTAMWSESRTQQWRPLTSLDRAGRLPERWVIDTNNRLFIGLKQGQTYSTSVVGTLGYQSPDDSTRDLASFDADLSHNLPSSTWKLRLQRLTGGYGGTLTTVQEISGTGALVSTTISQTWSAATDALLLDLVYSSGSSAYAGEDGASYVQLTNIRIKSTTAAAVTGLAIVQHIRDAVNTVNPAALSASNRLMVETNLDLQNAVWQDARPSTILDELAALGDASGNKYEWGVSEGRELYFRPIGSAARQWAIDASDLEVEQGLDTLYNATYATYEDPNGRTLRTATSTDATSVSRYGITRQAQAEADTASAAVAATIAATATAATATPTPRSKVRVRRFSTLVGAPALPEEARAGDTVTIRNLPPTASILIDRIRTFTIAQTSFNLDTGEVEIVPESTTPDLEFQIAFVLKAARS